MAGAAAAARARAAQDSGAGPQATVPGGTTAPRGTPANPATIRDPQADQGAAAGDPAAGEGTASDHATADGSPAAHGGLAVRGQSPGSQTMVVHPGARQDSGPAPEAAAGPTPPRPQAAAPDAAVPHAAFRPAAIRSPLAADDPATARDPAAIRSPLAADDPATAGGVTAVPGEAGRAAPAATAAAEAVPARQGAAAPMPPGSAAQPAAARPAPPAIPAPGTAVRGSGSAPDLASGPGPHGPPPGPGGGPPPGPDIQARAIVREWNHFTRHDNWPLREAHVSYVDAELKARGYDAAVALARFLGSSRGVQQPWQPAAASPDPAPPGPAPQDPGPAGSALAGHVAAMDARRLDVAWGKLGSGPHLDQALAQARELAGRYRDSPAAQLPPPGPATRRVAYYLAASHGDLDGADRLARQLAQDNPPQPAVTGPTAGVAVQEPGPIAAAPENTQPGPAPAKAADRSALLETMKASWNAPAGPGPAWLPARATDRAAGRDLADQLYQRGQDRPADPTVIRDASDHAEGLDHFIDAPQASSEQTSPDGGAASPPPSTQAGGDEITEHARQDMGRHPRPSIPAIANAATGLGAPGDAVNREDLVREVLRHLAHFGLKLPPRAAPSQRLRDQILSTYDQLIGNGDGPAMGRGTQARATYLALSLLDRSQRPGLPGGARAGESPQPAQAGSSTATMTEPAAGGSRDHLDDESARPQPGVREGKKRAKDAGPDGEEAHREEDLTEPQPPRRAESDGRTANASRLQGEVAGLPASEPPARAQARESHIADERPRASDPARLDAASTSTTEPMTEPAARGSRDPALEIRSASPPAPLPTSDGPAPAPPAAFHDWAEHVAAMNADDFANAVVDAAMPVTPEWTRAQDHGLGIILDLVGEIPDSPRERMLTVMDAGFRIAYFLHTGVERHAEAEGLDYLVQRLNRTHELGADLPAPPGPDEHEGHEQPPVHQGTRRSSRSAPVAGETMRSRSSTLSDGSGPSRSSTLAEWTEPSDILPGWNVRSRSPTLSDGSGPSRSPTLAEWTEPSDILPGWNVRSRSPTLAEWAEPSDILPGRNVRSRSPTLSDGSGPSRSPTLAEWTEPKTEAKDEAKDEAKVPPGPPLSDTVAEFGTRLDGAQVLSHVMPVPADTIRWLKEQVASSVGAGQDAGQGFRDGLESWLTPELLSAEWARLRSVSGLPVNVPYRGVEYPASLRLTLTAIGPGDPEMELMPDGAPVSIQRWMFGVSETGSTATTSELRSLNQGLQLTWPVTGTDLLDVSVTPRGTITYGQLSTQVTATQADQLEQRIRSKGKSAVFNFTTNWELRLGDPVSVLFAGRRPLVGWTSLRPPPGPGLRPLRVWFPRYSSVLPELPAADPGDPEAAPAPVGLLQRQFPHYGVVTFPDHDRLLADAAASFPELASLSRQSREDVREFLSEGSVRSNIPTAWGGHVASPTLYDRWGSPVGFLRFSVELDGGTSITGPTTENMAMELYVLRSHRMVTSSMVTDALGLQLPAQFTFGSRGDPSGSGGAVTVQGSYQHSFSHALGSGGSARASVSLRTSKPLLDVTPEVTFHFSLVRPGSAPRHPPRGTPLAGGKAYPARMLVPSRAVVAGTQGTPRHLPPELDRLLRLPMSTTPLEVSGTDTLFASAERMLQEEGYLPPATEEPGLAGMMASAAASGQRLDNQRKFDQFRSSTGLRARLSELVEDGSSTWLQVGGRRVRLHLAATRRDDRDATVRHERTSSDAPTLARIGSTLSGDEQFSRTPAAISLTVTGGAGNVARERHGKVQVLKEIYPEVVGSAQRSTVVDSSSGTGHDDEVLSPLSQGSEHFSVPAHYVLTADDGRKAERTWKGDGAVRIAVPTYRTLVAPDATPPAPIRVRSRTSGDEGALAGPTRGNLYDSGILRLPQSAYIDDVAGSRELTQAVVGVLNGHHPAASQAHHDDRPEGEDALPPIPGSWPEPPPDPQPPGLIPQAQTVTPETQATTPWAETTMPQTHHDDSPEGDDAQPPIPGSWPEPPPAPQPQLPVRAPRAQPPAPRPQAPARQSGDLASRIWRGAFGASVITPESLAHEVIATTLSPPFLKAHAHRMLRDRLIIERTATGGMVANRSFTVILRAYLKDAEILDQPPPLNAERWQQSANATSVTRSAQQGASAGLTAEGSYGGARAFEPNGSYVGNVTWTKSDTVSDSTGAWRVLTEDTVGAYRVRATIVYVAEVTQSWRNVLKGMLVPGPGHTSTVTVEAPGGLEVMLMASDFHAHPDLLGLPGMDRLPAASRPGPPPPLDRPLPHRFAGTGVIGFGSASEVEFQGGRSDLEDQITRAVEQLAPGAVKDGYNTSVDGVRSRINQVATGQGPASLVNAGPQGRVAFHWVHRSVAGHRLMEVSVTARPHGDLESVRGRRLAETSGLDNTLSRVTGDGSSLGRDGVVTQSQGQARSHALTLTPLALEGKHSQGPTFTMNTGSVTGRSRTSPREVRAWHRTAKHVNQYAVPYEYRVTVTSRPLTEAAVAWLLNRFGKALIWPGTVTGLADILPRPGWLPGMITRRDAVTRADVHIRFNDSETPQPGHATVPAVPPLLLAADPAHAPAPPPDAAVIDMEVPAGLRNRLAGQPWVPARPIAVYDFNAIPELRTALRTVDPRLGGDPGPQLTHSAEATSIVLASWASKGDPVPLTDAAAMHILGTTARPGSTVTLRVYDPQVEISSRDQAIDDVKINTDGFGPAASHTSAPSATLGVNTPLPAGSLDVIRGPSVPLAGHSTARGGYAQHTSTRREMLRYGTPAENAKGQGLPGHLVHAAGVIEVRGPEGATRWVAGDLTFRTTETPPGATPAYATRPDPSPEEPVPTPPADVTPADAEQATTERAQANREAARQETEARQAEADREAASTQAPADSGAATSGQHSGDAPRSATEVTDTAPDGEGAWERDPSLNVDPVTGTATEAQINRDVGAMRMPPAEQEPRPPEIPARAPVTPTLVTKEAAPDGDTGPADEAALAELSYYRFADDGRPAPAAVRADPAEALRADLVTAEAKRADMAAHGQEALDTGTGDSMGKPPMEIPPTQATETTGSQHAETNRANAQPPELTDPEPDGPS
jgi:hypothetical protein